MAGKGLVGFILLVCFPYSSSLLTPHLTGPWSASRPTGATSRRRPCILRKYMTQPPGKSRGEWIFYFASSSLHSALISPALSTLEQSVFDHDATPTDYFAIECVCFSPDGRNLAAGASDGKIKVRCTPCRSLKNHLPLRLPLDSVLFPQHARPAYPFAPHHHQIWNIATESILSILEGHQKGISSLDFSRDGRLIISGSWDNTVRIWDIKTKQHEMLSITVQLDVRVIATYRRVWHADALCVYGPC
jgi:WD40 repeat protein